MLKSCRYCGRVHAVDFLCPQKPKYSYGRQEKTDAGAFRSSITWQRKRSFIIRRDGNLCRECLYNGVYTSGDLQVHHITPLAVDFSKRLDDNNLITLCGYHHEQAEAGVISAVHLSELAAVSVSGS